MRVYVYVSTLRYHAPSHCVYTDFPCSHSLSLTPHPLFPPLVSIPTLKRCSTHTHNNNNTTDGYTRHRT